MKVMHSFITLRGSLWVLCIEDHAQRDPPLSICSSKVKLHVKGNSHEICVNAQRAPHERSSQAFHSGVEPVPQTLQHRPLRKWRGQAHERLNQAFHSGVAPVPQTLQTCPLRKWRGLGRCGCAKSEARAWFEWSCKTPDLVGLGTWQSPKEIRGLAKLQATQGIAIWMSFNGFFQSWNRSMTGPWAWLQYSGLGWAVRIIMLKWIRRI